MDDPAVDAQEREAIRALHSLLLKWLVIAFLAGVAIVVAGEMLARGAPRPYALQLASWCIRGGLGIATLSFVMGVISWFARETTKHSGFREQRLPVRFRVIAWSAVTVVAVAFVAFVWYSLSHGLTSW